MRERVESWWSPLPPASSPRRVLLGDQHRVIGAWRQVLLGARDGLAAFVLVALLFIAYGSINNRWYRMVIVTSGSMSPVFEAGDMIVITPPPEELSPGMIVCFQMGEEIVTHRIVGVDADGRISTKGDANDSADNWTFDSSGDQRIQVRGVYRGRISYLGYVVDWMSRVPREAQALMTKAEFRDAKTISGTFRAGSWTGAPVQTIPAPVAPVK